MTVGLYPTLQGPCSPPAPNQPGPQDAKASPRWRLEAEWFFFPCFLSSGLRLDVLPPIAAPRALGRDWEPAGAAHWEDAAAHSLGMRTLPPCRGRAAGERLETSSSQPR